MVMNCINGKMITHLLPSNKELKESNIGKSFQQSLVTFGSFGLGRLIIHKDLEKLSAARIIEKK